MLMIRDADYEYKTSKVPALGSIVAFRSKEGIHTKSTTPWRLATIHKLGPMGADGIIRQADVRFTAMPSDLVDGEIMDTVRVTVSPKRLDQLVVLVEADKDILEDQFAKASDYTEDMLNKVIMGTSEVTEYIGGAENIEQTLPDKVTNDQLQRTEREPCTLPLDRVQSGEVWVPDEIHGRDEQDLRGPKRDMSGKDVLDVTSLDQQHIVQPPTSTELDQGFTEVDQGHITDQDEEYIVTKATTFDQKDGCNAITYTDPEPGGTHSENTLAPSSHENQHQVDESQLQNTRQTVSVNKDDQELGWRRSKRVKTHKKCTCCLSSNALLNIVFLAMMCLCLNMCNSKRTDILRYVNKSETVLLHCPGQSTSIEWKKGRLGVQQMTENEVVLQEGRSSLKLKNVSCASQGMYECMFDDTINKTWSIFPFFLVVNMKPEIELRYTYNPHYMALGKDGRRRNTSKLEIECKVKSCSRPTVVMTRDGENIKESNIFNRETVDLQDVQNGHILTIRDPIIKDFSTYMCLAENDQGKVIRSIDLKQEIDLVTGISLNTNSPSHIIRTTRQTPTPLQTILQDLTRQEHNKSGTVSISVIGSTEGTNISDVTSSSTRMENSTTQEMKDGAKIMMQLHYVILNGHGIYTGQYRLQLICKVTSSPHPFVWWEKNGKIIKPGGHIKEMQRIDNYSLTVDKLSAENLGNYTCRASNTIHDKQETVESRVISYRMLSKKLGEWSNKYLIKFEAVSWIPLKEFHMLTKKKGTSEWFSYMMPAQRIGTDQEQTKYRGAILFDSLEPGSRYLVKIKGFNKQQMTQYRNRFEFETSGLASHNSASSLKHYNNNWIFLLILTSTLTDNYEQMMTKLCVILVIVQSVHGVEQVTEKEQSLFIEWKEAILKETTLTQGNHAEINGESEGYRKEINEAKTRDKTNIPMVTQESSNITLRCSTTYTKHYNMMENATRKDIVYTWTKYTNVTWQKQSENLRIINAKILDSGLYVCTASLQGIRLFVVHQLLKVVEKPIQLKAVQYGETDFDPISAYRCLETDTKASTINLAQVNDCNHNDYASYQDKTETTTMILFKRTSLEVEAVRCKLDLHVKLNGR